MIPVVSITAGWPKCTAASQANLPVDFVFQTTDPTTNLLKGTPNGAVDILAGALQTFLVASSGGAGTALSADR